MADARGGRALPGPASMSVNPPAQCPEPSARAAAQLAMCDALRKQIAERVGQQQQLIYICALIAGATLSFASKALSAHPEVMALLCLLYVGLSLALLRQDQEITILAQHLLDRDAFDQHAEAQARWEAHKYTEMQSGVAALIKSGAQTAGNYGVATLGFLATLGATVYAGPNALSIVVLVCAGVVWALFLVGAADVIQRYRTLGLSSRRLLGAGAGRGTSGPGVNRG